MQFNKTKDASGKILDYLKQHGETTRTDLMQKCFAGHLLAKRLDAALDELLLDTPPAIEMVEGGLGANKKRIKRYRIPQAANLANSAKLPLDVGIAPGIETANLANLRAGVVASTSPSSQDGEFAETFAAAATTPISPISHCDNINHVSHGIAQ